MIRIKRVYSEPGKKTVSEFWSIVSALAASARNGRKLTNREKSWRRAPHYANGSATSLQRWTGFRERYRKELAESGGIDALKALAQRSRHHEAITLVYGAADEHYQAVALKEFIDRLA